jgi:RNA polymerase-binding transcription factor DksA
MLTEHDLQTLRNGLLLQLFSLRQRLDEEVAAESGERYRDLAGEVTDAGDEAIGAEIAGTDNALIGHEVEEVRDLENALARMDAGTYGRCTGCDAEIESARLAACPACTRCVRCQSLQEKTYAGGSHPSL